jgi:hypothetical protein
MREKMAIGQVRGHDIYKLPLQELHDLAPHLSWANPPIILPGSSPIEVCQIVGEWYVARSDDARRREAGQFFTPPIVARYFRITNGNTQVNATELRKLPLPPWERLTRIGKRVAALEDGRDHDAIEQIIMEELGEDLHFRIPQPQKDNEVND